MSGSNTGRAPSGYPVVTVEHSAEHEATPADDPRGVLSRLRSVQLNGWEIALWVLAVLLILGSIQLNAFATQQLYSNSFGSSSCDSDGNCTSPDSFIYLQSALLLSPAGLVAGLLSAIVAIAVRALNSAALRHETAAPTDSATPTLPAQTVADPALYTSPGTPPPPAPAYPSGAYASTPTGRTPQSSFARPSTAPPAEPDLSLFQRPRDNSGA